MTAVTSLTNIVLLYIYLMYSLFPKLGYFSASGLSGVGGSAEIQKTGSLHRK